jgi:hypothetical protein
MRRVTRGQDLLPPDLFARRAAEVAEVERAFPPAPRMKLPSERR